jgi:hypothetical protein
MKMGSPADLRRPLPRYLQWTIGLISALFIVGLAWEASVSLSRERQYRRAQEWAQKTQETLQSGSRARAIRVSVASRGRAFGGPSFRFDIRGVALDDAEYAELMQIVQENPAPIEPILSIQDCRGDRASFELAREAFPPSPHLLR